MHCHYEILGISNSATSDEIKKAYRKLALEWHPDKNLHREDEAKEQFQLLQQAYEVLIDPQERAWYDRHKDEILNASGTDVYKDDSLDIFQYFNISCFKGYSDDEKAFYTVYRDVFKKISAEDEPFRDESDTEVPDFGYSYSSYDDVVSNFYAYWQSYCTIKTFSWIEQYNLANHRRAGAGRHVLRMIEKENKKLRDQHRKQRNEEVRQLVAFVRKRDKRVQAHKKLLEEKTVEKAKKFQDQRKKMIEDRQRDLEDYQETEWSSMSTYENHFNEIEANVDNEFGTLLDADEQDLYCVACDKDFRSEKSFQNHLNSKKHKDNVQLLKQVMQEEEERDHENQVSCGSSEIPGYFGDDDCNEDFSLEEPIEMISKKKKKKKKKSIDMFNKPDNFLDKFEHEVEAELDEMKLSDESLCSGLDLETQNEPETLKGRRRKKKLTLADNELPDKEGSKPNGLIHTEGDLLSCDRILKEQAINMTEIAETENDLSVKMKSTITENAKKKAGKIKGSKKSSKPVINDSEGSVDTEKPSTLCEKCGVNFNSRNKLFSHLKESGHAIYLGDATSSKSLKNKIKATKSKKQNR